MIALCATSALLYAQALRWVEHTIEVRQEAYEWVTALLDAETSARGFVAGENPMLLAPFEAALSAERKKAALVRELVADNPSQVHDVEEADGRAQEVTEGLRALVALVRAGHRDQAIARVAAGAGQEQMETFRQEAQRIRGEERLLLVKRRAQAGSRGWVTLAGTTLLALGSAAILVVAWKRENAHQAVLVDVAAQARSRLQSLSDLGAALAETRTRAQVADVIVEQGLRAASADSCTLHLLDEAGTTLTLIGDRGVAREIVEKLRRITASSDPRSFASLSDANGAIWAENDERYAALHPDLVKMSERKARAFWSVPLFAEDRPIGLLGAGFHQPREFSEDERAFVRTLTSQCAQALLRASRREAEDELRSWLDTTLRSIGDAVIATDAEGNITFMNQIAESVTGWREAEARGRPLGEVFCIFSEQTRKPVESPVARVLREGTVVGLANHTVLRSRRGEETPIDESGAPIRNEAGRVVGVVLVFRDATSEKRSRARSEFLARAGEALVSSIDFEAILATVAQLAVPAIADWCAVDLVESPGARSRQVAVAHADPSKVRFAREVGERYPPDPRAPRGVPEVIRSGRSELYAEIPQELLEGSARDAEHLRMIRELALKSAIVVALRAHGHTFGAMTFVYAESGRRYTEDDLSFVEDFARRAAMAIENALALKQADDARAKERWLRGEAEQASRAKDDFLATVSHELRTPLNAILGWTVMLRARKPAQELDRALVIIERNARTQTKLIEDVLDVSRIISGKLSLNPGPTNIVDAVAAAIETISPAATAKQISIHFRAADPSLTITADADRMQQIVWNLLSNAVKFTPKGGQISVEVDQQGSDVLILVRDTGEGIPPEALPIIFEPFQQADSTTTRRHGGLGLGLAIVKQLVSAHGGTVHAQSEGPGKGATFVLQLRRGRRCRRSMPARRARR